MLWTLVGSLLLSAHALSTVCADVPSSCSKVGTSKGCVHAHQLCVAAHVSCKPAAALLQAQAAGGATASAATNAAAQPAPPTAAAAAASDAHNGASGSDAAASTATARPSGRAGGRTAPNPKSRSQEIPKGRTTANQRMTRAAAARAAAELADTAPGSVMEEDEDDEEDMDGDLANTHAMQLHMVRLLTSMHMGRLQTGFRRLHRQIVDNLQMDGSPFTLSDSRQLASSSAVTTL